MRFTLKFLTAFTMLAVGLIAPAAQATSTSPFASDSQLRMFNCDQVIPYKDLGLVEMNKTSLEGTPVKGDTQGATSTPCGAWDYKTAAFNPEDSNIYIGAQAFADSTSWKIFSLQMNTGDRSSGVPVQISGGSNLNDMFQIAINPTTGAAYVAAFGTDTHGNEISTLYTVQDLTANPIIIDSPQPLTYVVGKMAYSPDGKLYAWNLTDSKLVTINPSTGATTVVTSNWDTDYPDMRWGQVFGMAFDSAGRLFFMARRYIESLGGSTAEIWYSSPSNNFRTIAQVHGNNPSPLSYEVNLPYAMTTDTNNQPYNVGMVGDLIITYGRQLIVYKGNGGTPDRKQNRFVSADQRAINGGVNAPITLPGATRAGYTLSGWFTAQTGGDLIGTKGATYNIPDTQNDNIEMWAHWTKNSNSGGSGSGGSGGSGSGSGSGSSLTHKVKVSVYFAVGSSKLTKSAKKTLRKLAAKYPSGVKYTVKGYVQVSSSFSNDYSLSLARAKSVAKYLKKHGVEVHIKVKGQSTPDVNRGRDSARRATILISPLN